MVNVSCGAFEDAFADSIIKSWPSVPRSTARMWLWDYLPYRYGRKGCDWSLEAAADLAREYMAEYGE